MNRRYPFKFLDAYNKADTDIFFGRDEEVEALYQMTFQSDILLVYGASGTGKTSLINCGLASRFQAHDWLALNIRRGHDLNASLQQKLEEASAAGSTEAPDLDLSWLDEDEAEVAASPLSRQLQEIYRRYFRPLYLIFDQFEELYILGSKAEQAKFIQNVQEIQAVDQPVKMIFVIREEYLGHLFEFERAVPQLLRKKLRVEPMNLDKVGQVVRGAAALDRSNVRLEAGQEAAIVEGIFEKIRGSEQTLAIQLPYLQVFLDKLYLEVTGDEARQAEAVFTTRALAEMGDIGDVLGDFLEEQAVRIQKQLSDQYPKLPEDAVWQILSPLATLEGTKEPLLEETLLQRLPQLPPGAVKAGLQALDQSRILRYDEQEGRYEVAHDSLAARIAEHRNDDEIALLEIRRLISSQMALKVEARALFSEKQLNLIDPYLDKLGLEPEARQLIEDSRNEVTARARRKRRRNLIIRSVLAAAAIVSVFFAIQANTKTQETLQANNHTKAALAEAEREKAKSDSLSLKAQDAAAEALAEKSRAVSLSLTAKISEKEAKAALDNLQSALGQIVDQTLKQAETDILNLDYPNALQNVRAAFNLKSNREKIRPYLIELAFFYGETGDLEKAYHLADTLSLLYRRSKPRTSDKSLTNLRSFLDNTDARRYAKLVKRYYPEMLDVKGDTFSLSETYKVRLDDYHMARTETTNWQYHLFCEATGLDRVARTKRAWALTGDIPVSSVSWYDAVQYANWVSRQMNLQPAYKIESLSEEGVQWNDESPNKNGYRLPTEAEWEFAARGGKKAKKSYIYSGSDTLDVVGWYRANSNSRPQAVGTKKANDLGIVDMSGNAYEWCWDWYDSYPEEGKVFENPRGPKQGRKRILRGGSWSYIDSYSEVSYRSDYDPYYRDDVLGFRLVQGF